MVNIIYNKKDIGGDLILDSPVLLNKKENNLNIYNKNFNYYLNSGRSAIYLSLMIIKSKIKNFKARWLEKKCELVELRQEIRLSNNDSKRFIQALGSNLHSAKILQPQWVDRIFNTIHFESFPSS